MVDEQIPDEADKQKARAEPVHKAAEGQKYGQAYEHELKRDFGNEHMHLKPMVPHHEDERLKIPDEKAKEHEAIAAQKQKAIDMQKAEEERQRKEAEPKPTYGESYERTHKDSKKDRKPVGRGITPKLDLEEPVEKPVTTERPDSKVNPEVVTAPHLKPRFENKTKIPCSTYGEDNKCEGMPCKEDDHCASKCCSTAMGNGA